MLKFIREYRFYCMLALLFFIPILSLNTSNKAEREQASFNFLDRVIVAITSPIQTVISYTIDHSARALQNYVFLIHTRRDYLNLYEENRKLLNSLYAFKEVEAENKRLRALLQFQEKIPEKQVTAQVIARDATTEFRSIRINKGLSDGIVRGMAVVTHEGIIGRVLRSTEKFADVITILDNLSSVDAIVQRTRAKGIIEGATDDTCILRYAMRTDDIEPGDVIISSGLDAIYPKGLMLGTVSSVNKKSFGVTQDIEVKPSVDFTKLEEVLVILRRDPNVLDEITATAPNTQNTKTVTPTTK